MSGADRGVGPAEVERLRRVTAEALMEHFAEEHLSRRQFEERIALARAATSVAELRGLLGGLPGRGGSAHPGADAGAGRALEEGGAADPDEGRPPPRTLRVIATLRPRTVDLTGVDAGVTEVRVVAAGGDVTVELPAGAAVDLRAREVLGRVERPPPPAPARSGAPVVRIRALALLGTVRLRGPRGGGGAT